MSQAVHRRLCKMWITPFSHAFRLTIVVDKPFAAPSSLDTQDGAYSFGEYADLRVFCGVPPGA